MRSISIPSSPGSYALILNLEQPTRLQIGHLGQFLFPAGYLVYLGSALGDGGLRARLGRHLRGGLRLHWHIDHLRQVARITGYCYRLVSTPLECRWTRPLSAQPYAWFPAPVFGASDCQAKPARCPAHLLAFSKPLFTLELSKILADFDGQPVEAEGSS